MTTCIPKDLTGKCDEILSPDFYSCTTLRSKFIFLVPLMERVSTELQMIQMSPNIDSKKIASVACMEEVSGQVKYEQGATFLWSVETC